MFLNFTCTLFDYRLISLVRNNTMIYNLVGLFTVIVYFAINVEI